MVKFHDALTSNKYTLGVTPGEFITYPFDPGKQLLLIFWLHGRVAEVRGEVMDIVRQLTLVYPVETFVFGAGWLLQRATHMPAPDAKSKCNGLKSNLYKNA